MKDRKSTGSRSPALSDAADSKKPQLSPEIQGKIGQQLRKIYDDMVNQGVPDRFADLLNRLDKQKDGESR
jgi:Anti-sigma factor NepR